MRYDRKLEECGVSLRMRSKSQVMNFASFRGKSLLLSYLSSSPPSFRTMFRKENTVPKMSFASSSALRAGRDEDANPLGAFTSEAGREALLPEEVGLGIQRRL